MTRRVSDNPCRLVEPLRSDSVRHRCSSARGDPAFLLGDEPRLHLGRHDRADEFKALLTHAIVRRPGDLRLHVQRILLCADTRDPAILGALCDLFLVLGRSGTALRRRLLALARPLLSGRDYHKLLARLDDKAAGNNALETLCAGSVLSRGVSGTTWLINRRATAKAPREDPLTSARQQLEYGHTTQAQETLERALPANPGRLALHLALLQIYRHTRDRGHVAAYWESLQGLKNPASAEWQRLLHQLEEEA